MRVNNSLKRFLKIPSLKKGIFVSVVRWMSVLSAIVIGIMMVLDVVDVLGRYFFLKPLPGAVDIIPLLLVWGGSWGMAYAEASGQTISVTFLTDRLPARARAIITSCGYLIASGAFFVIGWQLLLKGVQESGGESRWSSVVIGIPYSPFLLAFGIGAGMLCLTSLIRFLWSLFGALPEKEAEC